MSFPISRHRVWNILADAVLIALAWRLAFWLRFDQTVPVFYRHLLSWQTFALVISIKLVVFTLFGFYNRWWRYVSTRDMWGAARGVIVASLLVDLALYAFPPAHTSRLPRGVALIDMLLLLAFVAGSRLLARTLIERPAMGGLDAFWSKLPGAIGTLHVSAARSRQRWQPHRSRYVRLPGRRKCGCAGATGHSSGRASHET